MEKSKCFYGLVAVAFLLCSSKLVAMKDVGPCAYTDVPGYAVIRSVVSANVSEVRADEFPEVEVHFDFAPQKPFKKKDLKYTEQYAEPNVMTHHGRSSIPQEWVKGKGIKVGSKFKAIRRQITHGTCTPVIFVFPEFEEKH